MANERLRTPLTLNSVYGARDADDKNVPYADLVAAVNQRAERVRVLEEALRGILEIGKRDMSNPKYDGYFEEARAALAGKEGADGV
jgi:hypothetical protein